MIHLQLDHTSLLLDMWAAQTPVAALCPELGYLKRVMLCHCEELGLLVVLNLLGSLSPYSWCIHLT